MTDLYFEHHGSISILYPATEAGKAWVDEHILVEGTLVLWGGGIVVEPRYIGALVAGAFRDGLKVKV